jgi:hypothetical protein
LQTFYPDFTESVDVPGIPIAPLPIHHSTTGARPQNIRHVPGDDFSALSPHRGKKERNRFNGGIQQPE